MKLEEVYALCQKIAPTYGFDPILILALCQQESGFDQYAMRMEPRFYEKYVDKQMTYSLPVEALLSISWGLTQMMGESLRLAGYFDLSWAENNLRDKGDAMSRCAFIISLDDYVNNPELQIDWGCKWLQKKMEKAGGNLQKALGYWNGDMTGMYAGEVLKKRDALATKLLP